MSRFNIKSIVNTLLPLIVIILGAIAIFWFRNQNTMLSQTNQNLLQSSTNLENAYLRTIEMQWVLEGAHISSETQLIDLNNNSISLSSLVGLSNKPTFVLNFNWDACQDCIKQEMDFIQQTISSAYTVVIIISFDSINEYFAYVKSNPTSLPIYYASKERKILDGLTYDFGVYGFVLTKEGKISLPHLANSSFKELSKRYYDMLANRASRL
jgi:hypothetical protein